MTPFERVEPNYQEHTYKEPNKLTQQLYIVWIDKCDSDIQTEIQKINCCHYSNKHRFFYMFYIILDAHIHNSSKKNKLELCADLTE